MFIEIATKRMMHNENEWDFYNVTLWQSKWDDSFGNSVFISCLCHSSLTTLFWVKSIFIFLYFIYCFGFGSYKLNSIVFLLLFASLFVNISTRSTIKFDFHSGFTWFLSVLLLLFLNRKTTYFYHFHFIYAFTLVCTIGFNVEN